MITRKKAKKLGLKMAILDKIRNWFYYKGFIDIARRINEKSCSLFPDDSFESYQKIMSVYRTAIRLLKVERISLYF